MNIQLLVTGEKRQLRSYTLCYYSCYNAKTKHLESMVTHLSRRNWLLIHQTIKLATSRAGNGFY